MLQWMGGSRRKVTTSRKSTQKRQKQYFEQRKRQQQQQETALTDNNADNLVPCDHPKRNRSLDILSLLNVSKVAEERKPLPGVENVSNLTDKVTHASCVEDMDSSLMKRSKGHAYLGSCPTSSTPINTTDKLPVTESTVPIETRGSSLHQMGRLSSKSYRGNSSYAKNMGSEYFNSASSIQPSIFDIIGDDEKFEASEVQPSKEVHVAFSIEGLGTVGTETPMQSPQRPESKLHGKQSSFTKAAENPKSVNFNALSDDFAMEMECLMHNVEKPSRQHILSGDGLYNFTDNEHEMSTFKGDMQLDGKRCKMNSFYHEDRHDCCFNAASSLCFNDYEVDENFGGNLKKCDGFNSSYFGRNDSSDNKFGVNLKTCDGSNSSYCGRNDSSDFMFGRFHSPLRRRGKIPDDFNYLDGDCQFTVFDEPKYSSSMFHYQPQDHFSSFVKLEDMHDNLTSFSGESCSSTAVGGESTANVPYARHRKKFGKDLEIQLEGKSKENIDSGMWNRMPSKLRQGNVRLSWKHMRSGSSRPKTAFFSEAAGNEQESCLFEGDFPSTNINSHHGSSFFVPFEETQHRSRYSFGLDRYTDFQKSKYFFDASQKDISIDFSSENFGFHQPYCSSQPCDNSFVSKAMFEESSLGVQDVEIHVQSSNSPEVSRDDECTFPVAELSAQGSVTEEVGDQSKSQPPISKKCVQLPAEKKYMIPESSLPTRETTLKDYGGSCNLTHDSASQDVSEHVLEEDAEDTTLSHNFTPDPDDKLSRPPKELQGIIPALYQQEIKVCLDDYGSTLRKDVAADNLKGPKPKTTLMDPCYQLMTVERYVFKLFSVPNGKAAIWNAMNLF